MANELGKGDAEAVRFSIKVILTVSTIMGVIFSALCVAFSGQISYLFSKSDEVSEAVNDSSVILSVSILLNSIQPILSGNTSLCKPYNCWYLFCGYLDLFGLGGILPTL